MEQCCFGAAAYYNLTVAAFASVPVVATGLMAWHWQLEGQKQARRCHHCVIGWFPPVLWVVSTLLVGGFQQTHVWGRPLGRPSKRTLGLNRRYFVLKVFTFFRPASLNVCSTAGDSEGAALYTTTLRPISIASL